MSECANCGRPYKPLRKKKCQPCYQYFRRTGVERPASILRCACGGCLICRSREAARRRYRGVVYGPSASGRFRESRLTLPTDPAVLAYCAGIIDGEGCIMRSNGSWRVQVAMADFEAVDLLAEMGGSVQNVGAKPPRKAIRRWLVMAQSEVAEFLSAIFPYLRIKRDVAGTAVHEIASRHATRFDPVSTSLESRSKPSRS